jgi:glycine cleavage system regulatory protein
MSSIEIEHDWFTGQIGAYLSGGLGDEERARFESHACDCSACRDELEQIRQMESAMTQAFAAAVPGADFEDRLLGRLRLRIRPRPWEHPLVRRIAVAAAVGIVVAGFGYVGREYLEHGRLPIAALQKARQASNLKQLGTGMLAYSNENKGTLPRVRSEGGEEAKALNLTETPGVQENFSYDYSGGAVFGKWSNGEANGNSQWSSFGDALGKDRAEKRHVTFSDGHVQFENSPFTDRTREQQSAPGSGNEAAVNGLIGGLATSPGTSFKPSELSATGNGPAMRSGAVVSDHDGDFRASNGALLRSSASTITRQNSESRDANGRNGQEKGTTVANSGLTLGGTVADVKANQAVPFYSSALETQPTGAEPTQPGAGQGAPPQPAPATQSAAPASARRVIRDGVMEFEVESFDSAFVTLSKIVAEEGGFIAAADSSKLPNGKVRGTITLRVPPDRLDTLVLKLRALGELKSQRLGSKDISREYTDLESELRAARAMEQRLLEMIKTAQGKVADLLEAEKELGNWRTRIEKMTGQLNYYSNLVSLATLSVTAYEKDIRTPASASQTEEINTGLETDNVEHARTEIIKSIDEAKGRIIESELKQLEAGQLAAKVVAEVAPQNAGAVVDRLKQLGRVARLDIQRKQVADSAKPQAGAPVRVETAPTRLIISMYNLANVAPRLTTNLNLAGDDVEAVYRAILKRVGEAGGRVVSSSLVRQDAAQATGTIQFEVKASEADAVLNDIRTQGPVQVLRLNITENPDTANVTTAKQAFTVQIIPASQVAPRETRGLSVQTPDVEGAVAILTRAAGGVGGRVVESSLSQDNSGKTVARIAIEVPLSKVDQLVDTARQQGKVRTSDSMKNAQVPEGPLSRARVLLTISTEDAIVSRDEGLWATIRQGLGTSVRGLLLSLQLIIIGVCLVAPWVLLLWGGWKLTRRGKRVAAT